VAVTKEEGMNDLKDCLNGQWTLTYGGEEDWNKLARAAGWHEPIKTRLRVVECKHPFGDTCGPECKRLLTQAELVEVAEALLEWRLKFKNVQPLSLSSGAKIILVEDNDANGL
jgi:hypothetical protein